MLEGYIYCLLIALVEFFLDVFMITLKIYVIVRVLLVLSAVAECGKDVYLVLPIGQNILVI